MLRGNGRTLGHLALYLRYARGFSPGTVIDVGACDGTGELLEAFSGAHHILVEPLPQICERLAKVGGEFHGVALTDKPGVTTLPYPKHHPDQAQLLPSRELLFVHEGAPEVDIDTCEVGVTTLAALLEGRALPGPIPLKTDCQRFDLQVPEGASRDLHEGCRTILERCGYGILVEHRPEQGFKVGGPIVAAAVGVTPPAMPSISVRI